MNHQSQLLTIGEIAKTIGITRRIIINYENHGLIKADTRGEFQSGYRYYSMDTLVRIRTIRTFQKLGLSLDEIKNYLDGSTDLLPILKRLETLREELDENIELLKERTKQSQKGQIHATELQQHTVYRQTMCDPLLADRITHLRDVAYTAIRTYGTDASKRMYFTESSVDDPERITYCACVPDGSAGAQITVLPPKKALVKYHYGSYEQLPHVVQELLAYAKSHEIKLTGTYRCIFLEGPPQHKDPANFITIVAFIIDT